MGGSFHERLITTVMPTIFVREEQYSDPSERTFPPDTSRGHSHIAVVRSAR